MIYCLNNMKGFSNRYILDKQRTCMDNRTYPKQDKQKIGKLIHLKFKDEAEQEIILRLNIKRNKFPQFKGKVSYLDLYFKILRYDLEFPNTVILTDEINRVIVTDTESIEQLFVHPDYEYKSFEGYSELELKELNWDEFNEKYKDDKLHVYPIQSTEYLSKQVYIEYYNDLFNLNHRDQLPELNTLENYNRTHFFEDMTDITLRTVNKGYVIRADVNATDPCIVVLQINEKTGAIRYITDKEATFYFDDKVSNINLEDLRLWEK